MCLTADPEVMSSILVQSHTFVEIDHDIISMTILLASHDSRWVVVSYERNYVHKVLSQVCPGKKSSKPRSTDHPNMTIAVDWDVKHQTK